MGQRNEAAVAFLQGEADGTFRSAVLLDTLLDLGPLLMGPGPSVTLDEGDELQWSRYLGVGPDMASVTSEWLERQGTAVETIAGTVKADDQAVPGARVHVQDESGQVITMAVADEEGRYTAKVPANQTTTVFAESRGPGIYYDRAPGAGWYSPYAANIPSARTLSSIASGALPQDPYCMFPPCKIFKPILVPSYFELCSVQTRTSRNCKRSALFLLKVHRNLKISRTGHKPLRHNT